MNRVPECLHRRYRALDDMIREINTRQRLDQDSQHIDPTLKLMCDFWNILKEDPNCNLPGLVQHCFNIDSLESLRRGYNAIPTQRITCYMADNNAPNENRGTSRPQEAGESAPDRPPGEDPPDMFRETGGAAASRTPASDGRTVRTQDVRTQDVRTQDARTQDRRDAPPPNQSDGGGAAPPLSKVMRNLRKAASVDNSCKQKMKKLLDVEHHLTEEIKRLEDREKQGIELMKTADAMWSNMEMAYKDKLAQSAERQASLMKQVQAIEKSASKWRKNKKDLESQLDSIGKYQNEIILKISQKTNDLKTMKAEIEGFNKRIELAEKETEAAKTTLMNKKRESDARMAALADQMRNIENLHQKEIQLKKKKEKEGEGFIKDAREDLQQLCKVLLQKKLEQEDMKAEKNSLLEEINLLKDSCDTCKDRCKNKKESLTKELNQIDEEIQNFKLKCIQCSECVDTSDARRFCVDCPRCIERRQCLMEGDSCTIDDAEECVCQLVKEKFLDNVFENMYTVLERQIQTTPGKCLADEIASCLKMSRNGKVNEQTRRHLQEFILSSVKKKLNLTIVGGAVKTRCELDTKTYQNLMLCLKSCKATPVPKTETGTDVKKDPCKRWGGPSECNCPKGPDKCICTRKAPPKPRDPKPCPEPVEEDPGEKVVCPHKANVPCGPDCGAYLPNKVGADVAEFRPDPCSGPSCTFGNNMRAAQCVLGPEALEVTDRPRTPIPRIPSDPVLYDQVTCKCHNMDVKPCTCPKDKRTIPRLKIIEEVMGGYLDMTSIEKVATDKEGKDTHVTPEASKELSKSKHNNSLNPIKSTQIFKCTSQYILEDVWIKHPFKQRKRGGHHSNAGKNNATIVNESTSIEKLNKSQQLGSHLHVPSTVFKVVDSVTYIEEIQEIHEMLSPPKKRVKGIANKTPNKGNKKRKLGDKMNNTKTKEERFPDLDIKRESPFVEWVPVDSILEQVKSKTSKPPIIKAQDSETSSDKDAGKQPTFKLPKKNVRSKVRVVVKKNKFENIFDTGKIQKKDQFKLISHLLKKKDPLHRFI